VPPRISVLSCAPRTACCPAGNRLTELPATLAGMSGLQDLSLAGNQLTQLPDLSGLTSMTNLALNGNRLQQVW
jgi:Leucine-rich repeat (LRR) protein